MYLVPHAVSHTPCERIRYVTHSQMPCYTPPVVQQRGETVPPVLCDDTRKAAAMSKKKKKKKKDENASKQTNRTPDPRAYPR